MEPMEITIGIGTGLIPPTYLARCNGITASLQSAPTGTVLHIQFEPPPLVSLFLERLREEAEKIMPHLSEQSQEILWFMLTTKDGWATREDLIEDVWKKKTTKRSNTTERSEDTKDGTVHKAISDLNAELKHLNFGYIVTSLNRIHRLTPILKL